jgi:hypothetical protein
VAVAEHMALSRRVDLLERRLISVEPVRIRTRFAVYRRGPEPRCETIDDVYAAQDDDPCVELIGNYPDLDVLIDAQAGVHLPYFDGVDPDFGSFDDLAEGCRVIDVVISCYREQLEQIISDAGVTATVGGARAGKTRVLGWWLFRQWLLRGFGAGEDHEREAVFWWLREDSEKLYTHGVRVLLALWPDDVFAGSVPGDKTKNPVLEMIDGARVAFRHAHHSGKRAGTNLRSEQVQAVVIDELTAILDVENYHEALNRVGQSGGPVAVAYTPTRGHWVERHIEAPALGSGGAIKLKRLTMFQNPWWPFATMWFHFLRKAAISAAALVEQVLAKPDQAAAALEAIHDPAHRRMFFGVSAPVGLRLWHEWIADRYTVQAYDEDSNTFTPRGVELDNVTDEVVGGHFKARGIIEIAGKDFNVNPGVVVRGRVFGDPAAPTVLILEEIVDIGPTIRNAEHVARLHPGLCMFCDPTGAMDYRHDSHGAQNTTDAEEMRLAGLECEPAGGYSGIKVSQLSQLDSINSMHRAMRMGLLYVHARCTGVLRALEDMRAMPDGRIRKTSGVRSESDQISGYGDAARYMLAPIWSGLILTGEATHR